MVCGNVFNILYLPKMPKIGQNSIISPFFARRAKQASAKGRSPPQELEVGPRSGPYLIVEIKVNNWRAVLVGDFRAALMLC